MFVLLIVSLAALVTVTTAQCSGNLTNTSFVLSWSANNTYVRFTMSAPSNGDQYIGVGFFNSSRLNVNNYICLVDLINSFRFQALWQILSLLETMDKGKVLWKTGLLS